MSELLQMANEVEEDIQYIIKEGLSDVGEPYSSQFKAYTVIKGYQDLLRRAAEMLDSYSNNTWGTFQQMVDNFVYEIRDSIPEENTNE